jgi:ubiquinone biosynthesis protein
MSIVTAFRDMGRLRKISQVLVKHGFGELVSRMGISAEKKGEGKAAAGPAPTSRAQMGERLRLAMQELGPTFVKLGQMISTRPDLVPEEIVAQMKRLQDDVPPVPAAEARAQIEQTLGAKVEAIYASFTDEPLASASVGQVHRATLQGEDGEPVQVVVKVQRPGIEETVARDLSLLHGLARLLERTIPESRVYSPVGLVREFDRAITAELDFGTEADNATRFTDNFAGDAGIRFPRIYPEVSGKHVLTQEFFDGLKVTDAVRRGANGPTIAKDAVRIILKMVFEDGFFHADPHPGNVLILPLPAGDGDDDGPRYTPDQALAIGLIDLGLVGRLPPELRDRAVDLLMAAARKDADGMADAMLAIGRSRGKVDRAAFRDHVREIAERHLDRPLSEVEFSAVVRDIVAGAMKFEIEIPVELTMMFRALMTIEGVGKEIDPELDVLGVAKPYLARIVWQRYHPARMGEELVKDAGRLAGLARGLPDQLNEIIEDTRQGRLQIRTVDEEAARATDRLGRRVRAALLCAALLGSGVALMVAGVQRELSWGLLAGAGVWLAGHLFCDWRSRS